MMIEYPWQGWGTAQEKAYIATLGQHAPQLKQTPQTALRNYLRAGARRTRWGSVNQRAAMSYDKALLDRSMDCEDSDHQ